MALGYRAGRTARQVRELLALLAAAGANHSLGLDASLAAVELAGTAAADWPDSGSALRQSLAQGLLAQLTEAAVLLSTAAPLRARAGDALSRLGDPRFDTARFSLPADERLGFEFIPADPGFMIGTRRKDAQRVAKASGGEAYDEEFNDEVTPAPAFHIARYPVTVAQFRAFVEATGPPLGDDRALRDPDSRPVRNVSWREASAYCAWLQQMLDESPALATTAAAKGVRQQGWRVALPSELEWERAARGGLVGQVFTWGDGADPQRANYNKSGIDNTSVVGCFAPNGHGLFDMVGNACEWTRSPWVDRYGPAMLRAEALNPGDDDSLVVRGGSWVNDADVARCASRDGITPGLRASGLGFRVVLRSSPVSRAAGR